MSLSSLYMLRFKQLWKTTKPQENVFFFNHTAGDGLASDLATSFVTAYVPAINALQGNQLTNVSLDVINMGVPSDFTSPAITGNGVYNEDCLPPYAAVGYTLKVNTRAVRKGSKRFSGVPESVQDDGKITGSTYLTAIETLRVILQQELVSADDTWLPVIVKRVKTPVTGTVPLQYTYRLPNIDSELVLGEVVVALTTVNLSHQVSRKV